MTIAAVVGLANIAWLLTKIVVAIFLAARVGYLLYWLRIRVERSNVHANTLSQELLKRTEAFDVLVARTTATLSGRPSYQPMSSYPTEES